ncbi:glutathione S-transferase family protein [Baekduia sp. Peel2402]|uniref:glutathione S-transferase family protein n=1 Tax=Baekduia sp. Peel2402 TaxID=3458296 RepID=UPI00403E9831
MRLHAIPHSTNVHRVQIALALKGLDAELVQHAVADRSAIRALSGQDLVPVLETDEGEILTDSMPIVAWIDARWPEPHRLYPEDPKARREIEAFVDFFNFVWKVPPNAIDAARGTDEPRVAGWRAQLSAWQSGFDALLHDRPFLFGDEVSAADVCAYPFLRFATSSDPSDDDLFHGILKDSLPALPRLSAWVNRMANTTDVRDAKNL